MSYCGSMDGWILGLIALLLAVLFFYMSGQFSRLLGRLQGEHEQETLRMQRVEDMLRRLEKELREDVEAVRLRVDGSLDKYTQAMNGRLKELIEANEQRLREISGKVEERLDKGFEKTTSVFSEVQQRLALIDKAQQEMASLSGNVVSLKEILADKRSRGAFGEVQLSGLITNVMPSESYAEQYTFPSGVRADCVLFLPEPTGTLCIDAKFPLESFQRMVDPDVAEVERKQAEKQFALDIKKHIKDKNVYLTFDVDGFDSSIMPATGTPEPGGLFWDETLNILKIAARNSNIVGGDINELSPIKGFNSYNFLVAKLAYKILSYKFLL